MADLGTSMVIASVIVGMLSIPTAAQTVQTPENVSEGLPDISSPDSQPREVTTTSSEDSFSKTVSSAFQEFGFTVESDSASTYIEDSRVSLNVEQSPDKKKWVLETADADLRVEKSAEKTVRRVETPQGTLEKVEENGQVKEEFSGSDRKAVESEMQRLSKLLEERMETIDKRKDKMVRSQLSTEQYRSALDLDVREEKPEHVVISNDLSTPLDLEGWNLTDESGGTTLEDARVPESGRLYIYSADKPDGLEEKDGAEYVYNSGIAWNDGGDTATLWKEDEVVAQQSY